MIKNIIKRSFIGSSVLLIVTNIISIIISLFINDGAFYPISLGFLSLCDTELNAFILEFVTIIIFGGVIGSLSLIFTCENMSLLKRTIIHFSILTPLYIIVALIAGWIQRDVKSIFLWIFIFIAIYTSIWLAFYIKAKEEVKEMNNMLHQ